jgi:hypothetical protein
MIDYDLIEKLRASTAKHGLHSMLRLKRALDGELTLESDALTLGSAIHCYVLEPDEFAARYAVLPPFELDEANLTKTGKQSKSKSTEYYKAAVEQYKQERPGLTVLSEGAMGVVKKTGERIKSHPRVRKLLANSDVGREVALEGEILGVPVKGKLDLIQTKQRRLIFDIKTTRDASPRGFGRQFANLQYDFQFAWYSELYRQNYPGKLPLVDICAAETSGDYDLAYYRVPEIVMENAMAKVSDVVNRYANCLQSGVWPGVDRGKDKLDLYLPQWALEDAGDDLELEGFEEQQTEEQEAYF